MWTVSERQNSLVELDIAHSDSALKQRSLPFGVATANRCCGTQTVYYDLCGLVNGQLHVPELSRNRIE